MCAVCLFMGEDDETLENKIPSDPPLSDWPWMITPDYVNVVAVTEDERFLCFRQGKYGVEGITIQIHLEALARKQQEHGGWPITWNAISPACELEYRGVVTIRALQTLKGYGYLT